MKVEALVAIIALILTAFVIWFNFYLWWLVFNLPSQVAHQWCHAEKVESTFCRFINQKEGK